MILHVAFEHSQGYGIYRDEAYVIARDGDLDEALGDFRFAYGRRHGRRERVEVLSVDSVDGIPDPAGCDVYAL